MRVDDPAGTMPRRVRPTGGRGRLPREIRVSLLGTFALTADGGEHSLPKSARRLVALLALNPRGLSRSDAARRLTPHLETASARASLRKTLTRLRATRLPLLQTDGATLRLHPRVTVDVREAEALAARITDRSQPLPGDAHHEILTLEPLAGWDDEWAEHARTGLRGRFLRALDVYALRLASSGDPYQALTVAQQAWDSDPLHESTAGVLIELHIADGNAEQALRVYHALERHIAAARGREPSPKLQALVAPLLTKRPRS